MSDVGMGGREKMRAGETGWVRQRRWVGGGLRGGSPGILIVHTRGVQATGSSTTRISGNARFAAIAASNAFMGKTLVNSRTRRNHSDVELGAWADGGKSGTIDPILTRFQSAFARVTGWSVEFARSRSAGEGSPSAQQSSIHLRRGNSMALGGGLPAVDRQAAVRLAQAAGQMVRELERTRRALREREAELAAGVPITARPDEQQHLARRLEAILQSGGRALGCQGAALYLLDDTAQQLKLRACWGLKSRRFLQPPRLLRDASADLEALVGHVVAIEDVPRMRHWPVPEPALAAICVPVSTPTEPLGTLWLFCRQQRVFTPEQSHLAEIVAGRVAAELQREMLLEQAQTQSAWNQQVQQAGEWQRNHAPSFGPLLENWQLHGVATGPAPTRTGFFDWYQLEDERVGFALGYGEGSHLAAAMTAVQLQASVRAHARYPHHAATLVQRVNESLWQSSAGGHFAALAYGKLEPRTGRLELCTAGRFLATILRPRDSETVNLPSHPSLATQNEIVFAGETINLAVHETLVLQRNGGQAAQFARNAQHAAAQLPDLAKLLVDGQVGMEQTALLLRRKEGV